MTAEAETTPRSEVECIGFDSSRCGYCSKPDTSTSFGVWAHFLRVTDYQNLLDAGWRRSGSYLYRPDLSTTCCPPYVIRLEASKFIPSSTHKRVSKRLRRFTPDKLNNTSSSSPCTSTSPSSTVHHHHSQNVNNNQQQQNILLNLIKDVVTQCITNCQFSNINDSSTLQLSPQHIDIIVNKLKIFPPKNNCVPKSQQLQNSSHPSPTPSPAWCTNASMVIASAERNIVTSSTSAPVAKAEKRKNKKNKQNLNLKRQMDIATILCNRLQQNSSLTNHHYSVSVASPGFINFFSNNSNSHDDDVTDMETDMDADVDVDVDMDNEINRFESIARKEQSKSKISLHRNSANDSSLTTMSVINNNKCTNSSKFNQPNNKIQQSDNNNSNNNNSNNNSNNFNNNNNNNNDSNSDDSNYRENNIYLASMNENTKDGLFSMEVVPSEFRHDAFQIFQKYQTTIHKESLKDCSQTAYRRFLVDSPLVNERVVSSSSQSSSSTATDLWYGSFHILYKMNGKLFAVGVVDLLPKCLSSVYLFYDPLYSKLSPGTLSALKEIEWIKSSNYPFMKYYYMGYYIHSCKKMKYKISFFPSQLLCDETKRWITSDIALKILDSYNANNNNNDDDKSGNENSGNNNNASRVAPKGMTLSDRAYDFRLDLDRITELVNECLIEVNVHGSNGDKQRKVMAFKILENLVPPECSNQIRIIETRIRQFVKLVGSSNVKHFLQIIY